MGGFVAQVCDKTGMLQPLGFMARPLVTAREKQMSPRDLERRAIIATLKPSNELLVSISKQLR